MMDVNWVRTGSYTKELAKGILGSCESCTSRRMTHQGSYRMNFLRNSCKQPENRSFFWHVLSPDSAQFKRGDRYAADVF